MNDQIINDEGGGFDDAPVKVEVVFGGAGGPADLEVGDEDVVKSDAEWWITILLIFRISHDLSLLVICDNERLLQQKRT